MPAVAHADRLVPPAGVLSQIPVAELAAGLSRQRGHRLGDFARVEGAGLGSRDQSQCASRPGVSEALAGLWAASARGEDLRPGGELRAAELRAEDNGSSPLV